MLVTASVSLFASGAGGMVYRVVKVSGKWTATPFAIVDASKPVKVFKAEDNSPASDAKTAPLKAEPHLTGLAVAFPLFIAQLNSADRLVRTRFAATGARSAILSNKSATIACVTWSTR